MNLAGRTLLVVTVVAWVQRTSAAPQTVIEIPLSDLTGGLQFAKDSSETGSRSTESQERSRPCSDRSEKQKANIRIRVEYPVNNDLDNSNGKLELLQALKRRGEEQNLRQKPVPLVMKADKLDPSILQKIIQVLGNSNNGLSEDNARKTLAAQENKFNQAPKNAQQKKQVIIVGQSSPAEPVKKAENPSQQKKVILVEKLTDPDAISALRQSLNLDPKDGPKKVVINMNDLQKQSASTPSPYLNEPTQGKSQIVIVQLGKPRRVGTGLLASLRGAAGSGNTDFAQAFGTIGKNIGSAIGGGIGNFMDGGVEVLGQIAGGLAEGDGGYGAQSGGGYPNPGVTGGWNNGVPNGSPNGGAGTWTNGGVYVGGNGVVPNNGAWGGIQGGLY